MLPGPRSPLLPCCFLLSAFSICTAQDVIPFQGQLANQAGQPLAPTSAVTLVFRLYQQPVAGTAIWEESQPNISVNAGRFSVLLGSRTQLPAQSYFNSTLYLGITVDDGNPQTADLEMRPRQALVPVISATYAKNADKLNGSDWSAIFGVNSPTGNINGARISLGTITSSQIASNTITAGQIASSTITAQQLAGTIISSNQIINGSINELKLAAASVRTGHIADGAVTPPKLSAQNILFSDTCGDWSCGGATGCDVTNLTGVLTTSGRPVFLGLIADGQYPGYILVDGSPNNFAWVEFWDGTNQVARLRFGGSANNFHVPASSVSHIYVPAGGSHTYKVRMGLEAGYGQRVYCRQVRFVAYEL